MTGIGSCIALAIGIGAILTATLPHMGKPADGAAGKDTDN